MTNIYIIKNGDSVKIGQSKEIVKRKQNLQVGSDKQLYILYIIKDVPESLEKHLHSICKRYHIRGEFFTMRSVDHLLKIPEIKDLMEKYHE